MMEPLRANSNATARVWAVSERKVGTLSQCVGIGRFFDPHPVEKIIVPQHGLKRIFAKPVFSAAEPRPDIVISCGYRPEKPVLKIKKAYRDKPLTVHLQRPEVEGYDLVFVSRHDWVDELETRPGYFSMTGVPHRLDIRVLQQNRASARATYSPDDSPIACVFVGGANGAYAYDKPTLDNISEAIGSIAQQGWRVLVSTSRRSDRATLESLLKLQNERIVVWDGGANNPYLDFVSAADAFVIAKDSITMPCEALSTGKPVYILDLTHIQGERLEKFERFHRDLRENLQLTRPFFGDLSAYPYIPLNEAGRIAAIISTELKSRR